MVASSLLPIAIHNNKLYFLFGREGPTDDAPGWADFGGGVDKGETIFQAALREGGEELTGFLGDNKEIEKLIKSNGGVYKITKDTSIYNTHIFLIDYDEQLPLYYNRNHTFLLERVDNKYLSKTKLFEKVEIGWFTVQDIKMRIGEFRHFYQETAEHILSELPKIEAFLRKNRKSRPKSNKSKKRRNKSKSWKMRNSKTRK